MFISPAHSRTIQRCCPPGLFGAEYRRPKRERPALQRPGLVNRTALLPENTIQIGFFLQRKPFFASGGRNPAAKGFHELSIPHLQSLCQNIEVFFRKKYKTALVPAA
jgi:hypothetical protein